MNRERSERAQTAIDFAIAMGVFLVALTTVVAFMPGMIQPFTGAQDNPLVADRLASQLADDQLAEPGRPGVLNGTCTRYFFNDSSGDPCPGFENDPNVNPGDRESLNEKLGVDEDRFVNVTLRKNVTGGPSPDLVCSTVDGQLSELSSCTGEVMATGPEPPEDSGSITSARRRVAYGSEQVYVEVKVWV